MKKGKSRQPDHPENKPAPGSAPQHLRPEFARVSTKGLEVELKMLVAPPSKSLPYDEQLLHVIGVCRSILAEFDGRGTIMSRSKRDHLITFQLDTSDQDFHSLGQTIRIRGNCPDMDLTKIRTLDICVKTDDPKKKSARGPMWRGEFETKIDDKNIANALDKLRGKYPREEFPDLWAVLDNAKTKELREFFRIDCLRSRYLIKIDDIEGFVRANPDHEIDIDGQMRRIADVWQEIQDSGAALESKQCFAEMNFDFNAFVLDIPNLDSPVVFHWDAEIEAEIMFKACAYDNNPDKHKHISTPMTKIETLLMMAALDHRIKGAAPEGALVKNSASKADRGFANLNRKMPQLQKHLKPNLKGLPHEDTLVHAFVAADCDPHGNLADSARKIHHLMEEDFGPILTEKNPDRHTVAHRKPKNH